MRDPKLDALITELGAAITLRYDQLARRSSRDRLYDPLLNAMNHAQDFLAELRRQRAEEERAATEIAVT